MNFFSAIKNGFRTYAEFHGRASRPEFWWWALFFVAVVFFIAPVLDEALFGRWHGGGEAKGRSEKGDGPSWGKDAGEMRLRQGGTELYLLFSEDEQGREVLRIEGKLRRGDFFTEVLLDELDLDEEGAASLEDFSIEISGRDLQDFAPLPFGGKHFRRYRDKYEDWHGDEWSFVWGGDEPTPISDLSFLALLLPTLAAGARRLRDRGVSPWWWLIAPTGLGLIVLAVLWAQPGKNGTAHAGGDAPPPSPPAPPPPSASAASAA